MNQQWECRRFNHANDEGFWEHGPGAFYWEWYYTFPTLMVAVPNAKTGRGIMCSIPVHRDDKHPSAQELTNRFGNKQLVWWWNGDEDKPTIRNSINWKGVWHGWIADGLLKDA